MSVTVPFVLVEDHLAIPHLRPLEGAPFSFGHEWSLLPPNISFRAELKALYAAVIQTVCLADEMLVATYRRISTPMHRHAAAQQAAAPAARRSPMPRKARKAARHSRFGKVGVMCAFGGAAMLGGVMIGNHLPRLQHMMSMAPAASPVVRDVPDDAVKSIPSDEAIRSPHSQASVSHTPAVPVEPRRLDRQHARELEFKRTAPATRAKQTKTVSAPKAHAAGHQAAGAAKPGAVVTPAVRANRSIAQPSQQGRYSPPVRTRKAENTYSSIEVSVDPEIRALIHSMPAERVTGAPVTDPTEWVNHMSQRRLTDVPERFSSSNR